MIIMNSLSSNIYANIFSYLHIGNVIRNISLTSKKFNKAVKCYFSTLKKLNIKLKKFYPSNFRFDNLQSLYLFISINNIIEPIVLQYLSLKKIKLVFNAYDFDIKRLKNYIDFSSLPSLTHITIKALKNNSMQKKLFSLIRNIKSVCINLKKFKLLYSNDINFYCFQRYGVKCICAEYGNLRKGCFGYLNGIDNQLLPGINYTTKILIKESAKNLDIIPKSINLTQLPKSLKSLTIKGSYFDKILFPSFSDFEGYPLPLQGAFYLKNLNQVQLISSILNIKNPM